MTDETETPADVILRMDAIEIFGVTYAHEGDWRQPIEEILGSGHRSADPFSRKTYFDSEQEAVEHVRARAMADAEAEMVSLSMQLSDRKAMLKLWLARNWSFARRLHLGELTTHAILSNRMKAAVSILENGPTVRTERLPDVLRVPAILSAGSDAWVFDIRGFPDRPVSIRKDTVSSVTFHRYDGDGFDVVARYALAGTGGIFAYDHASPDRGKLDGPPGQAEVFLTEERARERLASFANKVRSSLDGAGPYLMLPAPGDMPAPTVSPEATPVIARPAPDIAIQAVTVALDTLEPRSVPAIAPPAESYPEVSVVIEADGEPEPVPVEPATVEAAPVTPDLPAVVAVEPEGGLPSLAAFLMSGLTIRRPRTIDAADSLARVAVDEAEAIPSASADPLETEHAPG